MGDVRKTQQHGDLVLTESLGHRFMGCDSYWVTAMCPKQHIKLYYAHYALNESIG